jgi:hypothetical protein
VGGQVAHKAQSKSPGSSVQESEMNNTTQHNSVVGGRARAQCRYITRVCACALKAERRPDKNSYVVALD